MAILSYIKIEKFRSLPPEKIDIGSAVTVIAGYNATSKSTLLGMVGQGFGKKESNFLDIFGNNMGTEFSEIFKMSQTYDKPGEHVYYLGLTENFPPHGMEAQVKSRSRTGGPCRLVTGRKHEAGWGNLAAPVIYLGLKRLYPLGELRNNDAVNCTPVELSAEEHDFCKTWYSILTGENDAASIEQIQSSKTTTKQSLAFPTANYDSYVISSGQDNIGKILAAIVSFWRLKKNRGTDYKGGLLLIDEVDASLHPSAQRRLLDLFILARMKFDIQTIVTTHSLSFLEYFTNYKTNESINRKYLQKNPNALKLLYLHKENAQLKIEQSPSWEYILTDLQDTISKHEELPKKLNAFVEDAEAKYFLQTLLPADIKSVVSFETIAGAGCDDLINISLYMSKKAMFKNNVFIVDGDARNKKNKNLFRIPGTRSPERELMEFMENLPESNALWAAAFTKRKFMANRPAEKDRKTMKNWFKGLLSTPGKRIIRKFIIAWAEQENIKVQNILLQTTLSKYIKTIK